MLAQLSARLRARQTATGGGNGNGDGEGVPIIIDDNCSVSLHMFLNVCGECNAYGRSDYVVD